MLRRIATTCMYKNEKAMMLVAPSLEKHASNPRKWNRPAKLVGSVPKIQLRILIIMVALAKTIYGELVLHFPSMCRSAVSSCLNVSKNKMLRAAHQPDQDSAVFPACAWILFLVAC